MKTWVTGILLCLASVNLPAAGPRTSHQTAAKLPPVTTQEKETDAPLIDHPLHLADFPNMQPRADLRANLAHVSDFIQNAPFDGQPATEKTEVWMAHTKSTLYFVFICYDRHPELIRGHLARRENILNDDTVAVLLDPFRDRRLGIVFRVNPAGVQADASWSEANGPDYSYDTVWDSEGRVTKDGWMALIAIPFRSLRFRSNESDWGVVFVRFLPRNSEAGFLAARGRRRHRRPEPGRHPARHRRRHRLAQLSVESLHAGAKRAHASSTSTPPTPTSVRVILKAPTAAKPS